MLTVLKFLGLGILGLMALAIFIIAAYFVVMLCIMVVQEVRKSGRDK